MKIAVFHNLPPGGAKRTLFEEAKYLSQSNTLDLYEYSYRKDEFFSPKDYVNKCFRYQFKIKSKLPGFLNRLEKDWLNFVILPFWQRRIANDINSCQYDLVLVHPDCYTETPFLLRYLKEPAIYYCHELLRIAYESVFSFKAKVGLHKKIYEWVTRKIRQVIDSRNVQAAKSIAVSSKFIQAKVKRVYDQKSYLCYPGVNSQVFKPCSAKKKQMLFMGNKLESEGYNLLLSALELIPKNRRPKIKHLTFRAGKTAIENDRLLAGEYSSSLATLCLDYEEPFGLKTIESMACGTPAIAVAEGGYLESVVNGQNGFLIKRSAEELANKIGYLTNHVSLAKEMGLKARKSVVENWSWQKHGQKLQLLMENLVAQ